MQTQKKVMDYEAEMTTLRDSLDYFKPKQGTYKIVCLGEANPIVKEFKKADGTVDIADQLEIPIETAGKRYIWTVTKSTTKSGLYGQIIKLAIQNKNSLTGVTFDLFVKNDGKKNDYTIPQSIRTE